MQEQRFRITEEDGRSLLFILAHGADVDGDDLCRFRDEDTRVRVEFDGEPGLASAVAYAVTPV